MLVLHYGDNTFALKEKKADLIDEAQKEKAALACFDAERPLNPQKLPVTLASQDLFCAKKYFIFSDLLSAPQQKPTATALRRFFKDSPGIIKDTCLTIAFFELKPAARDPLFQLLKKKATIAEEHKLPKGAQLESFLAQYAQENKIEIEPRALTQLCVSVNHELWPAVNELQRLHALKKGRALALADIESLSDSRLMTNIFNAIDALARQDKQTALKLMHHHLQAGDDPFYLLAMIAYQFRSLVKIKDALDQGLDASQIASRLKLHPFIIQKGTGFCQKFSASRLHALYQKLAQIDSSAKQGGIEPRTALDLFIAFS